jgi:hypothetical protein
MDEKRGNGLLWSLVGCGALLFVGLCAGLFAGGYFAYQRARTAGPGIPQSTPGTEPLPDKPPTGQFAPPDPRQARQPPLELTATVTRVTGSLAGRVSRSCRFVVEATETPGSCRTQITCDAILVYGGATAGYFPCRFDSAARTVSGADTQTTTDDGDGAMTVDTASRTLQIHDDASGTNGEFSIAAAL